MRREVLLFFRSIPHFGQSIVRASEGDLYLILYLIYLRVPSHLTGSSKSETAVTLLLLVDLDISTTRIASE